MANLLRALTARDSQRSDPALSIDQWMSFFSFNGTDYPVMQLNQTMGGKAEEIGDNFLGYVESAYKRNGVVFACMLARLLLFSEARFQFRKFSNGRPGDLFGTQALQLLETPWPNGTTGDLLTRMIQDADLAGNFYGYRESRTRLRRMRPDWVTIILGSMTNPDVEAGDLDCEIVGYLYHPRGLQSGQKPVPLLPGQVAHFAPIPDPAASFRGMSWLTPVLREIMADGAATTHKLKFFENGATPNLVVSLDPSVQKEAFKAWIETFEAKHEGYLNAYKTLYLGGGADAKVVGSDFKQMDFAAVQGRDETRIAAAAGVPPIIVGLSEGLESATYSLPYAGTVWTAEGPRPIGELRPGDRVWTWLDGRPALRRVTWQGCTGANPVYTVKTKNRTFQATGNHPVLMPDGSWRRIDELRVGDKLIEPLGLPDQGRRTLPDGTAATPEVMRWLGAYIGDGCLNGDGGVRMCIPREDRARAYYDRIPPRLFTKSRQGQWLVPSRRAADGLTPRMVALREQGKTFRQIRDELGLAIHPMSVRDRVHHATRTYRGEREPVTIGECRHGFQFHSKQAVRWHRAMGVTGSAKTKRIPGWVFELNLELRLAFLAGLVDTDGSVGRDGRLVVWFANRPLVEDVRMLLISCGIQCCNISQHTCRADVLPNRGASAEYHAWGLTASSAVEVARIPFHDPVYRERVECNQHRQRVNRSGFRIRSIEPDEVSVPVYDIEVEDGHSFLADGVVVHNSNYGQARRRFSDATMRPLWRNAAASLANIVDVPAGAQLWYDDRDVAFLQEDMQDLATIQQTQAQAIRTLVDAGFEPESVIAAVMSNDFSKLGHSGLYSVQLQPAGTVKGDVLQGVPVQNGNGTSS